MKRIYWIGSSLDDLKEFPSAVRKDIGQALFAAQCGVTDPSAKALKGFTGAKVMEIVERYDTDAYRAVYTVQFEDCIYVLHAFQKKSKQGIRTTKRDMNRIRSRLAEAKADYQERRR